MFTQPRATALVVTLALLGAASFFAWGKRPIGPPAPPLRDGPGAATPLAGTASCSARGCHGAPEPAGGTGLRLNEYTAWLAGDPHARAYAALLGPRARRMARNLAPTNPAGREIPAHQDSRCLACHANPLAAVPGREEFRAEGVGCESCHGAARGKKPWLEVHATPRWRELGAQVRATEYGMTPLGDPDSLARACVGCHIGAPADADRGLPARDLNHDLIAAGHPRLNFELAGYHANIPPHWRPANDERSDPGHAARLWAVGQVVSARASLDLLLDRAKDAADSRPWPEFAEYSCSACHADIRGVDWRRPARPGRRKPGSLPYSAWYSSQLAVLAPRDLALPETFDGLRLTMSRPFPDRKAVTALARKAAGQLDFLLGTVQKGPYDRAAVRALFGKLAAQAGQSPALGWEEQEQFALAVAALAQADRTLARARGEKPFLENGADKHLRALFRELAFPLGFEGPARSRGGRGAEGPMKELLKEVSAAGG